MPARADAEPRALDDAIDAPSTDGTIEPLREAAREVEAPRGLAAVRTPLFTILAVAALLVFGALTVLVTQGLTTSADLAITRAVQSLTARWVASLMLGFSWIGFPPQSYLLVVAVGVLFWLAGFRAEAAFAVGAAGSDFLTEAIKSVVGRPRPASDLVRVIADLSSQSFPSGHTLFYTTFFGFLAYLAYARLKRGWLRTILLCLFGLLILLVGPSRVWMGQHWASDVLASYTLGFAYLVLLVQVYSGYRRDRAADRAPAEAPADERARET